MTPTRPKMDGRELNSEPVGEYVLATLAHLLSTVPGMGGRDVDGSIAVLQAQLLKHEKTINNIVFGVCLFDSDSRLVVANRQYAEIYGLAPDQVRPGMTLSEIVERRSAVGTCPTAPAAYVSWTDAVHRAAKPHEWTATLKDGRTIKIHHEPLPEGGWVSTHEDVTEFREGRALVNERISLQTLIDWVPDYLWVKDRESRFLVANRALAADCGRPTPGEMVGLTDFDLHSAEAAQQFRECEKSILITGRPMIDQEELIINAVGIKKWLLSTKVPVRNARGEIYGVVGISRDITARKLAEGLRDGQARILEMIALGAPIEAVLHHLMELVDSQLVGIIGSVLLLDDEGARLRHGAAPGLAESYINAIDGVRIGPVVGSCGTAAYRRETVIVADIATDPLWQDYRQLAAEHGYRSCWSTPIFSHQGLVLGTFAMYSRSIRMPTETESHLIDVATRIAGIAIERKHAEDRIHHMANHDSLTGLPNRKLLKDRLSQALLYAERDDQWGAVVFIDLDNFKFVNDSLGHNAGDELLKVIADRMLRCVGPTDTVVRFGGDEFVVLISNHSKNFGVISAIVHRIRAAIAEPIRIGSRNLRVTSSIGVASYPGDGHDADVLIARADAAMYRAKESGRDGFRFYTPNLNEGMHERFVLQEELRSAVANDELFLLYQPQIELKTERVFGVEALVRWRHPTLGVVAPARFVPLAEETELIVTIGDWVLREACRQNKVWQDAGMAKITVSVNVSARQFAEGNFGERVATALKESGLEPMHLELELTESLVMQDINVAISTMTELQKLGVRLAIDDFGTGYSSLAALKNFPVGRLKIDKSFIADLADSKSDRALTSAVISLGQKLDMRVIAEGVETDWQLRFLRDNNCDEVQGYLFSAPISAEEIAKFVTSAG